MFLVLKEAFRNLYLPIYNFSATEHFRNSEDTLTAHQKELVRLIQCCLLSKQFSRKRALYEKNLMKHIRKKAIICFDQGFLKSEAGTLKQ